MGQKLFLELLAADWLVLAQSEVGGREILAEMLKIEQADFEEPFEQPFVDPNGPKQIW